MDKQKVLLFIGAHPDDETFGIGGTLAQYAAAGVKVYYTCATRGEAGDIGAGGIQGYSSIGDMRWAELKNAANTLGLIDVIHLGYRDSGMSGSEDNKHPEALINAPVEQVAERITKVIRDIKPQVIITADPIGGYRHPDHIAVHNATVKAFYASGDPKQYSESGQVFQPQKLYFNVFPHKLFKLMVKLMPLFGQDPHRQGKNNDIDMTKIVEPEFPVHAVINLTRQAVKTRELARACHTSQIGGRRPVSAFSILNRIRRDRDLYMRGYPEVHGRRRESDLFEGIQ